jgi:hypothetical protein
MGFTASNLIMGPGSLYTGTFGALEPTDTLVNTAPPASAWTDIGGTSDGVTLNVTQEYTALNVDQSVDVVERRLTSREVTVATSLAEPTLTSLNTVLNNTATSASGSGWSSLTSVSASSATQPTYIALMMDGYAPTQKRRRVIVRKALSTGNMEVSYSKDNQTLFPVTWSAHAVSNSIAMFKIVDEQ